MPRTAALLVTLVLIAATSAAFAVTEKLKVGRAPIGGTRVEPHSRRFSPICNCPTRAATFSVVLRRTDTADVSIVDAEGRAVRTLVEEERLRAGRHTFVWDGRSDAGALLPDGTYRLRVHLKRQGRTIVVPVVVHLDATSPRVRASVSPHVISPNGDGVDDRVEITYRTNELGFVDLSVDGALLKHKRAGRPRARHVLFWGGRVPAQPGSTAQPDSNGRVPAAPGDHELVLSVQDVAGNVTNVHFTIRVTSGTSP